MKIVLLLGASSAGKSTLCNALVKEHGWYTHGSEYVGDILEKQRGPLLLEKLREVGLVERLSPYMNDSALIAFVTTGQINLVHGDIYINHQFKLPDLQRIEAILSQAGFEGKELEALIHSLREVVDVCKAVPMPNGFELMLDDLFKLPPDASVILDEVPPIDHDVNGMLYAFKEQILERAKADGRKVEYAAVLAFSTPKVLSDRILHRNESAAIFGDLRNKREGMFPFLQLSQLISTAETDGALDKARTLSKMQLLLIALKHLPPGVGDRETKKAKAIFKAGAHEYRELMKRFRLSETSNVIVSPREDLDVHAVIDLSKDASPSDLARELIVRTMDIPPLSTISPGKTM